MGFDVEAHFFLKEKEDVVHQSFRPFSCLDHDVDGPPRLFIKLSLFDKFSFLSCLSVQFFIKLIEQLMACKLVQTVSLNDWFELFINFTFLIFVLEVIKDGPHFYILGFINISLIELIEICKVKQVLLLLVELRDLLPSRVLISPIFIKSTELTIFSSHVIRFDIFFLFETWTS